MLVLIAGLAARLIIRLRRIDLWRVGARIAAPVVILRLLITLRLIETAAARRRIARRARAAVGGIDVVGIGLPRSQHDGIAGGVILRDSLLRGVATRHRSVGSARSARERNLGGAG